MTSTSEKALEVLKAFESYEYGLTYQPGGNNKKCMCDEFAVGNNKGLSSL